jgi:hypothetical protein
MRKKINNVSFQFDFGALEILSAITGKDALDPVEGLSTLDRLAAIFAAGEARYLEENEASIIIPSTGNLLNHAKHSLKSWNMKHLNELATFYQSFWSLDVDIEEESDEEKKREQIIQ